MKNYISKENLIILKENSPHNVLIWVNSATQYLVDFNVCEVTNDEDGITNKISVLEKSSYLFSEVYLYDSIITMIKDFSNIDTKKEKGLNIEWVYAWAKMYLYLFVAIQKNLKEVNNYYNIILGNTYIKEENKEDK
jgi:hypothetical protein